MQRNINCPYKTQAKSHTTKVLFHPLHPRQPRSAHNQPLPTPAHPQSEHPHLNNEPRKKDHFPIKQQHTRMLQAWVQSQQLLLSQGTCTLHHSHLQKCPQSTHHCRNLSSNLVQRGTSILMKCTKQLSPVMYRQVFQTASLEDIIRQKCPQFPRIPLTLSLSPVDEGVGVRETATSVNHAQGSRPLL